MLGDASPSVARILTVSYASARVEGTLQNTNKIKGASSEMVEAFTATSVGSEQLEAEGDGGPVVERIEELDSKRDEELVALRRSLTIAKLELELCESARDQAASDLALTRYWHPQGYLIILFGSLPL